MRQLRNFILQGGNIGVKVQQRPRRVSMQVSQKGSSRGGRGLLALGRSVASGLPGRCPTRVSRGQLGLPWLSGADPSGCCSLQQGGLLQRSKRLQPLFQGLMCTL